MATLEKIRGKAGLLVAVIGVALLAFIIGDLLNSGQTYFRMSANNVASVNGEKITYDQFAKRVDELTEYMKLQYGQSSLPKEATTQINENAFESLVTEILMDEEAGKIGLTISKEELADLLQGEHVSPLIQQMFTNPQTGVFDKTMLLGFIQNVLMDESSASSPQMEQYRSLWLYLEKMIKQQRLIQNYNTLLVKAVMPNKLDVQSAFDGSKENVNFAYAVQPYTSIADSSVQISDSELKDLYNKKKESLKQSEKRVIKYLYVDIIPSEEDYKDVESRINAVKEEFAAATDIADVVNANSDLQYVDAFAALGTMTPDLKQFASSPVGTVEGPIFEDNTYKMYRLVDKTLAPDSVKARYIVLPLEAEQRADSLINVLNNGGDFAALAAEYSADQNSASRGGDLGWFTEVAALQGAGEEFKAACFSAKGNEIKKLKTDYSILVLQVTDRTANVEKAKIAEIAMSVSPSSKTFGDLYNKVNQYIAKNNDLKSFEDNAAASGFAVLTDYNLAPDAYSVGAIRDGRQAVRWAFNNKKGQLSEIIEADNKFVVLGIAGVYEQGYASIGQVRDILKAQLLKDKKAELIMNDLKGKNLTSLDGYAQAMKASVDTAKFVTFNTRRISGMGEEPMLNGLAPFAPENQLQGPIKGNEGVFVFSVISKTPTEKGFDAKEEQQLLENAFNYRAVYQTLDVLRKDADITDSRVKFF